MTLKEYSRLLQPFIPVRADWVAIDEEAIRVFTKRPELIGVAERHLRWKGPCVAIIRYWKDFLDGKKLYLEKMLIMKMMKLWEYILNLLVSIIKMTILGKVSALILLLKTLKHNYLMKGLWIIIIN